MTPTLRDGKKYIVNCKTQEIHPFELEPDSGILGISIGRYLLSPESFDSAELWTKDQLNTHNVIIIDELGKLELKDKGFHDLFSGILLDQKPDQIIIAVVRKSLVADITEKYCLDNALIFEHPHDLTSIFR